MPEDAGWDPNWWRSAKASSIERKAAEAEAVALALAGDSFLIVTEGIVTEPTYFRALRADLRIAAVRVAVEPSDASDPRHVIDSAVRLVEDLERRSRKGLLAIDEARKFDQVWAVIDTDVSERLQRWPEIVDYAAARNVRLAQSTRCFEYWLILHVRPTTHPLRDGAEAKALLRADIGEYSCDRKTAEKAIASLLPNWPAAVRRAEQVRQYHLEANMPAPANPSTEVDRLVTALNYSAPVYARKLHRH